MSRYHHCDHRSDQQCPGCVTDQVAYELEIDKCDGSDACPARFHIIGCASDDFETRAWLYLVPNRPPESP